jgi:hypothetical protein
VLALGLCLGLAAATPAADEAARGSLFRIFLTDGSTLTSYGDFATVGERVVFSLPVGEFQGQPRLHLASIPASQIDWERTNLYAEATRAAQYAATRGEADFAGLSTGVARLLNEIATTTDRTQRLQLALEARSRLAAWPSAHFGYRASEIQQILALVDEVISDLRASAGEARFDLNLVADVAGPPPLPPLPPPSLQESILQALWASKLAGSPAERRSLIEAALGALDHGSALPTSWALATRDRATRALRTEDELDARVKRIRAATLAPAETLAARGDVRRVEHLLAEARRDGAALAVERGDEIAGLLAALEGRLDVARRVRLALDQWALKADVLRTFERTMGRHIKDVSRSQSALHDIRTLAGPSLRTLEALDVRFSRASSQLATVTVPPDGRPVHAVLTSAVQLAANAVRLRRSAVTSGDMQQAWDASAAAAGALMLLDRARADVARLVQPPRIL